MWFVQYPASTETEAAKRTQHKDNESSVPFFTKPELNFSLTFYLL